MTERRAHTLLQLASTSLVALTLATAAYGDWPSERRREILDSTLTVRLAPDLSALTAGERRAVDELLKVGEIVQRLYELQRHPEAKEWRARLLATPGADPELAELYRIFQGPIATTPDNRREPFVAAAPELPGKNVYPVDLASGELERFLADQPQARPWLLDPRTVVRRGTRENLRADLLRPGRSSIASALQPGLMERLRAMADRPNPDAFYALPYALTWPAELESAFRGLTRAAQAVEGDDPELARYLRNRGRDLVSNDYESGDASWVTGRFGRLNVQIGAYESYDDALFGVKAFFGMSILLRDDAATEELAQGLGGLQEVEDALPYEPRKRVRSDLPVGVYQVIADFGQARGTNTASILPNDPLFARRYGRIILMRGNILGHPELGEIARRKWRAAVAPAHAEEPAAEGGLERTLWHEIGHYLGPDATAAGGALGDALESWADAVEEMKSDLVALFALQSFHARGIASAERLRAVEASGILRTLQDRRPRRDQPYQTMQLAQFNWFLDRGLIAADPEGRLEIRYERYSEAVRSLLAEVLRLQTAGDSARAQAFFERWTTWTPELHEPLAERLRAAGGPRYRSLRYAALGD